MHHHEQRIDEALIARILASPGFVRSDRMCRFLRLLAVQERSYQNALSSRRHEKADVRAGLPGPKIRLLTSAATALSDFDPPLSNAESASKSSCAPFRNR